MADEGRREGEGQVGGQLLDVQREEPETAPAGSPVKEKTMENFGFAGLAKTIWQRVFVSYKSTLLGLALVGADAAVSYLTSVQLPTWLHAVVGVAASVLALYKSQAQVLKPA